MHIPTLDDVIFIDIHNINSLIYYDEGYSFGLNFFETILITDHGIFLDEHVARLNHSLEEFGIAKRITVQLIEALISHYKLSNIALKVSVSDKNVIASVRSLTYSPQYYEKGAHVTLSSVIRPSTSPLVKHKSANYGDLILALRHAKHNGFDDCLLQNEHGRLTESCIANLFIIKNGTLLTPSLDEGVLPGIVRSYLIKNFPIIESRITTDDLLECDGAFLTNSLMGLVHISQVDATPLRYHPMVSTIASQYFAAINKEI